MDFSLRTVYWRPWLFCDVTRPRLAFRYRRLVTTCNPIFRVKQSKTNAVNGWIRNYIWDGMGSDWFSGKEGLHYFPREPEKLYRDVTTTNLRRVNIPEE